MGGQFFKGVDQQMVSVESGQELAKHWIMLLIEVR